MDLIIEHISKRYGDRPVLTDFSAVFPRGRVTVLMAPSGVGKTTLLRLILGLEQPDSGRILGVPEGCSALFQEDRLFPGVTVLGNLRAVLGSKYPEERMLELLTKLGLAEAANLPAAQLSGGMARRTALARALLYESELLILDEPFNGLDAQSRTAAAEAILEYRQGRTVLAVTHREDEAALLRAHRILRLN